MVYNKKSFFWGFVLTVVFLMSFIGVTFARAATPYSPGLVILSPAGALTPSPVVRSSFVVSFTTSNFTLVEPGQYIQVNNPHEGHIHVFLDEVYYAIWDSERPIPFNGVQVGNHTIKLQLVNNDHTPLTPDISKVIAVSVTDAPLGAPSLTILSPSGALNTNSTVGSSFKVSYTVGNFLLSEPVGQPNAINTGHVHIFLDNTYYGLATSETLIPFDNIPAGQHTVKLQLVNSNHTPLKTDVSKSITLTVKTTPASAVVDLSPITGTTTTLFYLVIVNIFLTIILIIVVILRKPM